MLPGVLILTPVLLTCRGVLLTHEPPNAASVTTSFFSGTKRVCGANIIGVIPWSIPGSLPGARKNGTVTQYILFKIPVASASNCIWIACKITLCVTRGCCVWFVIFSVVDCQIIYCTYQIVWFIYILTCKYRVCILYLGIGYMTECVRSNVIGIRYWLLFYDFTYLFSNILIG